MQTRIEAVASRLLGLCLVWCSDPWERIPVRPNADFSHLHVEEAPGSVLQARGSTISRTRDGITTTLRCTDAGGNGEIRDLALDPAGACFVAAERGLFLVSPETDALDRVDLRPGAPPGAPTSVFVDARRRVWVATDAAFGVIDPCFFWGRTCSPSDGVAVRGRSGVLYRVAGDGDAALLVDTPLGLFRYRPDAGAEPRVSSVTLQGVSANFDDLRRAEYGEPWRIAATGSAEGGPTFRWRLDGHHVWRDLELETPAKDLSPGAHLLEVIALDRDLNRSSPFRVPIAVDYPRRYEPRVLVPIAGALALGLVAWNVARSLRRRKGRASWHQGVVSGLIVVVLLGEVVAGLVPHAKAWPFVGFSMYTEAHEEGSVTYDEGIVGIDADGGRRWIEDLSMGRAFDNRWQVLGSILDGGEPVARAWLARHNELHPEEPLTGLQVCARRRRLTRDGPVPIAPLVFGSYLGIGAHAGR